MAGESNDLVLRSAEFLQKLREEAANSVIESHVFTGNKLNGCVIAMAPSPNCDSLRTIVRFSLNGEDVESVSFFSRHSIIGRERAFKVLAEAVAAKVAEAVMSVVSEDIAYFLEKGGK